MPRAEFTVYAPAFCTEAFPIKASDDPEIGGHYFKQRRLWGAIPEGGNQAKRAYHCT